MDFGSVRQVHQAVRRPRPLEVALILVAGWRHPGLDFRAVAFAVGHHRLRVEAGLHLSM